MTLPGDPYRVLGLTLGASANEIRSAYRRLAKQFHPDAAGERALPRFLAIQAAYELLIDVDGELRMGRGPGARPGPGWAADPDRARATRDAYRARRAGWGATGARTTGHAGTGTSDAGTAAPGAGPGTRAGRGRSAADGPGGPAGQPGAGTGATGAGRRRPPGATGRRPTRKATQGSTTYDEAAEIPRDPSWQGAGWYGPASGTFWTINPREYADPRKHGPEYQARARRAAEDEAARRAAGLPPESDDPDDPTHPLGDTAGTEAEGARAGWQWAQAGPRAAGVPGSTTDAGADRWSAEGWSYRPEHDAGHASGARSAWDRASRMGGGSAPREPLEPLPDLEALIGRLSPRNLRAFAARGDIRTRVALALVGWPPIGFGVATLIGELSGCASFSAGCVQAASWVSTASQPAIVALLVLLPAVAAVAAFASLATLAVTVPLAGVLGLVTATASETEAGRGLLGIAAAATYLVALGAAVIRGRGSTRDPSRDGAAT